MGEKERERNINWLPLVHALTGGRTYNPGMCPDRESNWRPLGLWNNARLTEPHTGQGPRPIFFITNFKKVCTYITIKRLVLIPMVKDNSHLASAFFKLTYIISYNVLKLCGYWLPMDSAARKGGRDGNFPFWNDRDTKKA